MSIKTNLRLAALPGLVVLTVGLFLVFSFRLFIVGPPEIAADHAFQTDRAFSRLVRILAEESPHAVDSLANDGVRERLLSEIRSLGFSPIVRDDFHCSEGRKAMRCARVRNVMFWINQPGPNAVMVASHYDSVPAGPGAGDDGAGVAASLEIAALLKDKNLARPVLVLITDGEEIGLVGAASFVAKDPFAKLVSAVVSMEARGVSGPVAMFQTSTPNGRDVSALKSDIKTASSNSLASDVYERMPNGTDVTEYLALDIDVGNFAIGGSPEFYHTSRDNLAMLDKRSFFHLGASAFNTVEAYLEQSGDEPEQQWIYTDFLGVVVLALPQLFSMPLIVLAGFLTLAVFFIKGSGSPVRSLMLPFVAIVLGVGFALAVTKGIDAVRAEAHFAAAHPWALRAAQNSAALFGALLAMLLLGRTVSRRRLLMSSWACLALLGGVLSLFFAGAAILIVPALVVMILCCCLIFIKKDTVADLLALVASIVFLVIVVPISALGEMMLFLEYAAPFTIFVVFCLLLFAPHFLPLDGFQHKFSWKLPMAGLGVILFFTLAAAIVPAYSVDAPRGLSIIQFTDADSGETQFGAFAKQPLPSSMTGVAPFKRGLIIGFEDAAYVAKAPSFETLGVEVIIQRDEVVADQRLLTIQINAADSDIVTARLEPGDAMAKSMSINGVAKSDADTKRFLCHGRDCRSITLNLAVSIHEPELNLQVNGFRYGLEEAQGLKLLSSRPASVLARGWGDLRLVSRTIKLK
jgi:hypothetical protein